MADKHKKTVFRTDWILYVVLHLSHQGFFTLAGSSCCGREAIIDPPTPEFITHYY